MENKIKVVWITHFSNKEIRSHIKFDRLYYKRTLKKILLRKDYIIGDFAVWNTSAIRQFEKFDDIDLTIVFPHRGIRPKVQRFDINGIHYIAFRSEDDYLCQVLKKKLFKRISSHFKKNRNIIASFIADVQPDIVHIIGAEIPYYSIAALDIPNEIPSVVTLQTLMSDPNFFTNYPISKGEYEFRSDLEKQIIRKCCFIGSSIEYFKSITWRLIKKDAVFLNLSLAVGVDVDESPSEKEYDFVYFAANISKACDFAIEAFALANKHHPGITLNVSGSYQSEYKAKLELRLEELGIQGQVFFTGPKVTHEDVIKQIKKSRYALLPLKVDLISGTIREAMACGLPVVTTITPATPSLNKDRESVLLSEKGDFQAMADNMIRLVENESYASQIRINAIKTIKERYSNECFMQKWRKAYHEIVENSKNGTPFSEEIVTR